MKHLTPEELVDYLEDRLAAARAAHVSSCDWCHHEAETMRALVADAGAADVPEPSPLFWDHFSARVREAVAAGPSPQQEGSRGRGAWRAWVRRPQFVVEICLAAAALALVVVLLPWRHASETPSSGGAVPAVAEKVDLVPPAADAEWALVVGMADGVDWDTAAAAGLDARPGAAEHAVMQLSSEEQSELLRLLRAELKRPSL